MHSAKEVFMPIRDLICLRVGQYSLLLDFFAC